MASDGKVTISTELDNSGIEKGVKQIKGSLGGLSGVVKKLGVAIAAAFSVKQIVSFAREASQASMQLSDALTGLQSILEGQGRSFSEAQRFIEEYTQDGLIPATNAITAYKNLASRGYDDSQIRSVMTALKDASAYGRQASMTMGDAVQSATEGLKNENSILVDNAGVTKNVAKMWEEYAASIGTTANNLTQQQKIQAEVTGILQETRFQTGDAATVAGTLSGQLQQLSFNFNNLKIAIGNAINPIIQSLLPTINAAVQALTRFTNAVASVVGLIFGKASVQASTLAESNDSIAATASAGAAAEEELADATTAAGKAAEKSLASFDEINKLQDSSGGGGGASSGAGGGGSSSSTSSTTADAEVEDTISPKLQAIIDKIKAMSEEIKTALQPSIDAWSEAFSGMGSAVENVKDRIGAAWSDLKDNSLAPFGKYIITKFVPSIVNTFSKTFAPIFADVMPAVMDVWATDFENTCAVISEACDLLERIFEGVSTIFSDMCESISNNWNTYGSALLQGFEDFQDGLWKIWWHIYDNIISPVVDAIGETLSWLWDKHLKTLWDDIVEFILSVSENILALWNSFLKPLVDFLIALFAPVITNAISLIVDAVSIAVAFVSDAIGAVLTFLDGLIQFVVGVFTLDWERAWGGLIKVFEGVWKGLEAVVKGAANTIIWVINTLISAIYSGIAGIVNGLGNIVSNVGNMLGKKWGFSVPARAPKIPYLAQGAVLPANKPFLAMVGDQKNGTNVEAPLETIKQALAEVMAMQESGDINITFTGDLAQLGRILKPVIEKENRRVGGSLAKEVTG